MSNVRSYTDKELLEALEKTNGFDGSLEGYLDIWIRSNEDAFDRFDDKVYTFHNGKFIMVCTGTSNTGSFGLKSFDKYGVSGAAILCANNFVRNGWQFGYHKGNREHPAYIQVKGFPYTRDSDKDDKAEEYGTIYINPIGANCHRASKHIIAPRIGNYSVACLVRDNPTKYEEWLRVMNRKPLSVAIIPEF